MSIFWSFIIGAIIIIWFIRFGYQIGCKDMTYIPVAKTRKKWSLKNFFGEQVTYSGEKTGYKEILKIFGMALAVRLGIYLIGLVIIFIHSDAASFTFDDFLNSWNRWDTPHYIDIADKGYANCTENNQHLFLVFFPLYPWLLRLVHILIPDWELACLVLSTLAYAIGCCFFYAVLAEEYTKAIAYKTLVLLSVFPFSFFFGAMMTESLFFCLMAAGFYFIKKHNWLAVGITGIFCSLYRIQGLILLGVAGVEFLITYPPVTMYKEKRIKEFVKTVLTKGSFLLLIPTGTLIYLYINYRIEGNPFQFMIYQREHWYHNTTYFTNNLSEIITNLQNSDTTNTLRICIWIPELLLFLLAILLLIYGMPRHPLKYTAYLLVYTLVNYSVTFLISGGRYMTCAFPLFIIAGEFFERHPKIYQWVIAASAMLMAMYITGYFEWKQIM